MIDNPKYKIVRIVISLEWTTEKKISNSFYRSFVSINLAKSTFVAHTRKSTRNQIQSESLSYLQTRMWIAVHHSGFCCFLLDDTHVYCLPGMSTHTHLHTTHIFNKVNEFPLFYDFEMQQNVCMPKNIWMRWICQILYCRSLLLWTMPVSNLQKPPWWAFEEATIGARISDIDAIRMHNIELLVQCASFNIYLHTLNGRIEFPIGHFLIEKCIFMYSMLSFRFSFFSFLFSVLQYRPVCAHQSVSFYEENVWMKSKQSKKYKWIGIHFHGASRIYLNMFFSRIFHIFIAIPK